MHRLRNLIPLLLLLGGLVAGCETRPPSFDEARGAPRVVLDTLDLASQDSAVAQLSKSMLEGTRSYRLNPGDVVEVQYLHERGRAVSDYHLGVGDEFEVMFPFQPDANHTYVVRPDGRIALPQRGEVTVAGRRPADLAKQIEHMYADLYVNPDVTVNVSKFRTEADDFLRMVAGEYGPHIQSLTISPAGEIQLPAMTSIHTSGLTIDNLNTLVGARVSERYGNINGSVRLVSTGTQQIFVFGEVQKPGPVSTSRERSILQLVGAAGGPTEFAAMNAVRVLYWDAASIPHIRQANLEKVLESASFEQDMSVPVNSVVYVPPTHLAQAGRMVDQVLRKLFLFQGFSAGIQYNLGTSRINP